MRAPEIIYVERLQRILDRLPLCYAEPISTSLRRKITDFGYVPTYPPPLEGNENKTY